MARGHLKVACLVLFAAALAGSAAARSLHQFDAQKFCPDGCTSNGCIQDATKGGLRCQKCNGNLVVNKVTGNCACPAGKYVAGADSCTDCPKGSYCPGSDYFLPTNSLNPTPGVFAPLAVTCPNGMTTVGKRSISNRACVNLPGNFYTIDAAGTTVSQAVCPVNTYSPGLKKQRACVPCPTGYITNGVTGATSPTQCVVPAGYYLKAPGQIAPCPKGEYKSGVGINGNCTKCAFGVTTLQEGSISVDNCTIVVPGYYPYKMSGGIVTATVACPQGYYCPGGGAQYAFDPAISVTPNPAEATIKICPNGLWTVDLGSIAAEQCLTPPGYKTTGGATVACPAGTYRADWKPADQATDCLSCGDGVQNDKTDRVTKYDVVTNQPSQVAVSTASDDCFIMPGQGLYYTVLTQTWRAKNCIVNSYGVSNKTYGLTPYPCRDCPTNMVTALSGTNATYPTSAQYFIDNGDALATKGFTDVRACVTIDGYGYNGRIAQACDQGTYNSKDNYETCKPCGFGLTTEGVGKGVTAASCGLAAGFGLNAATGTIMPCPIGTYNALDWQNSKTAACTNCTLGLTTAAEGANSASLCSLCIAGYGGANCATQCGGVGPAATYGPPGRTLDQNPACVVCSNQSTGYSFDWNMNNDLFQGRALSKLGASSPMDCVSELGQLMDGAWYIELSAADANVRLGANASAFTDCAVQCRSTPDCAFVVYDYQTTICQLRIGVAPVYVGSPLLAFKNLPSGDVGTNAWSKISKKTKAKMVSTGSYTFYRDESALVVGNQVDPVPAIAAAASNSDADLRVGLQNCLNACDNEVDCAGITIKMNVDVTLRPTTCKLIMGSVKLGVFKRSVMRADTSRMALPSLKDL